MKTATKERMQYGEILAHPALEDLGWSDKASAAYDVLKFQKDNPDESIPWASIRAKSKKRRTMSEYEMLKAVLEFMNHQGLYLEFEKWMSDVHDLNDEELEEQLTLMHNFNE